MVCIMQDFLWISKLILSEGKNNMCISAGAIDQHNNNLYNSEEIRNIRINEKNVSAESQAPQESPWVPQTYAN